MSLFPRDRLADPVLVRIEVSQVLTVPERLRRGLRLRLGASAIVVFVPLSTGLSLRLLRDLIDSEIAARIPCRRILDHPDFYDRDELFQRLAARAAGLLARPQGLLHPDGSLGIPEAVFPLPAGEGFALSRVRYGRHYRLRLVSHPGLPETPA